MSLVRPRQRFTRADRLRRKTDFSRVYDRGRRAWARGVSVFVAPGESDRHRLGLTVRRQVGTAVLRNRVKRRLREAFRLLRDRIPGCYDIVVNARAEVADMPFDELCRSLLKTVRRAARDPSPPRKRRRPEQEQGSAR